MTLAIIIVAYAIASLVTARVVVGAVVRYVAGSTPDDTDWVAGGFASILVGIMWPLLLLAAIVAGISWHLISRPARNDFNARKRERVR